MKYKRVLLKLSGEVLMGNQMSGLDADYLDYFASEIRKVIETGVQLTIVVGGGNIFRGRESEKIGIEKVQADYMGMIGTVINGLALQSTLEQRNIDTRLMSSIQMDQVCEPYIRRRAIRHLERNRVVILSGGMGSPCVTTDSAASWKAFELNVDILLKGTRVDGIYSADPEKDKKAVKYDKISFQEALLKDLNIMDLTAFTFSKEHNVPIIVFNINKKDNLFNIVKGESIGTVVSN